MNMKKEAAHRLKERLPDHPNAEDFVRIGLESGLISPKTMRDFLIRADFEEEIASGQSQTGACWELAEKYSLSKPAVHHIVKG